MSAKTQHPAAIGAFVIGAIALLILAALALGGHTLFERKLECVAYFEEDIGGLDVGAPVEYQGVRIGTVTGVALEFDIASREFHRPVRFRIEPSRIRLVGAVRGAPGEGLERLVVEHGLRAQLANQSILTGKLKIGLGNYPGAPLRRLDRNSDIWEMPTIPSPLATVTGKLADLPFADIVTELRDAISGARAILQTAQTNGTVARLDTTLESLGTLLSSLNEQVRPVADQGGRLLDTATGALEDLRTTLRDANGRLAPLLANLASASGHLDDMLAPDTSWGGDIPALLADLRDAARSLRLLLDYLEQHPEALVQGKQPQP